MSQIDWSKAPEGAEVHFPNQAGTAECFAIFREDGAYYAYPGMTAWTRWSGESKDSLLSRFKHSFKEWNVEGLPPVGTVCEYQTWVNREWKKTKVLAHHLGFAVHSWSVDGDDMEVDAAPPQDFRPIRTPEQIAAEERQNKVNEMMEIIYQARKLLPLTPASPQAEARVAAEALYDANFRQQVAP